MTIAEVDDESSETGAENGRLGEARGGFGREAEEEDAQGDVDAASADSAGGGHSGGEEPDDGRRSVSQVRCRREVWECRGAKWLGRDDTM